MPNGRESLEQKTGLGAMAVLEVIMSSFWATRSSQASSAMLLLGWIAFNSVANRGQLATAEPG